MPVQVQEEFLSAVVDYVEATSNEMSKVAAQAEKVAEAGPLVVDKLIKLGMLNENARADAIAATRDPVKVLDSLGKTAEEVSRRKVAAAAEPEIDSMGKGEGEFKTAAADGSTDNYGRKESMEKTAANRRFFRTFIGSA